MRGKPRLDPRSARQASIKPEIADFGQRLDAVLLDKQLTYEEAAAVLYVHRNTISNWVAGVYGPNFSQIQRLAMLLPNTDLRWLITGSQKVASPAQHREPSQSSVSA